MRSLATLTAALLAFAAMVVAPPASQAAPADAYSHAHFGRDIPPGCKRDSMRKAGTKNVCHHMRTGLNGLDSPVVDVLIAVPISPFAERDARIMRQAVEMWRGGIDYLAPQMGLDWLDRGVKFRITVDTVDPTSERFSLFPVVDPEIVVIASNPVGALGIGIDPVATAGELGSQLSTIFGAPNIVVPKDVPCSGYGEWLFDFGFWDSLPGFDSHHTGSSGTFSEDCGGGGGNVCFAVNTAQEARPKRTNENTLFDLVAHEFGHCLTLGHVGDGAEGAWSTVPTNDIMAYSNDPVGLTKCVSTLDVEVFATRMSDYLDVNSDGLLNSRDHLSVNDPVGDLLNPFQTQHPRDHSYASRSGDPRECPQPSLGALPGPRTDWTPTPSAASKRVITLTKPDAGARTGDTAVHVAGTVRKPTTPGSTPTPASLPRPAVPNAKPRTVTFEHEGGNRFSPQDTSLGTGRGGHAFDLEVAEPSEIAFKLSWRDATGLTDLDLRVTGAADSASDGASSGNPETVNFSEVHGKFVVTVDPYLIARPVTYNLTARITPVVAPADRDGDDTVDEVDVCIDQPGSGADGCPVQPTERVLAYVDDNTQPVAAQYVDTTEGSDRFAFRVPIPKGTHTIRVVWASTKGKVFAIESVRVTRT